MKTHIKLLVNKFLVVSFSSLIILSCEKKTDESKTVITVTTSSISQITQTSAKSGGSITITGNATIDGKGVCWSMTSNPTVNLSTKTADGTGSSSYTSSLTGLTPSTTYYVRAYATYSEGVVYGNELTFTTGTVVLPTVTTSDATNITQTTVTLGGNVTSDGGATVTERGVCYSTTQNPTVDNSKVQSGSGTGSYTANLTGLSVNTSYYARAYAKNSTGVNYGIQVFFTTLTPTYAFVITEEARDITPSSAFCSGKITSNGYSQIISRGICYSNVSSQPDMITGDTIEYKGNNNTFEVNIPNLKPNTKYYYRAFAINGVGISLGIVKEFTTLNITIGMPYQGGVVAYIFNSYDMGYVSGEIHGLIAKPSDQGFIEWGRGSGHIDNLTVNNTYIGYGKSNTDKIIAYHSRPDDFFAAHLCRSLGEEWFLPSIGELDVLYQNRALIGGFNNGGYWSSNQGNIGEALGHWFSDGSHHSVNKSVKYYVRAVKYF